ncbi:MAG: hypothetical protein ACXU9U_05180 [Parachlamydiaceae bacterium]
MMYLLFVALLLSTLIGVLTVCLAKWWVFRQLKKDEFVSHLTTFILQEMNPKELIVESIASLNLPTEFASQLDLQLDKLIVAFKAQIPMASMFLTPTFIEKLKEIARPEILKMLPEMEQKMLDHLENQDYEALIQRKLSELNWSKIEAETATFLTPAMIAAGCLGGLIGLIQLLVIYIALYM